MFKENLDANELLFLAIRDSESGDHESAISKLKQALTDEPKNAQIQYMLAAEHAEIGMYERAADGMAAAIALEPSLYTASFQLGLLHMTNGNIEKAIVAWEHLDELPEDEPLLLFKVGLSKLAEEALFEAKDYLERGIKANQSNPALNNDMERVLGNINDLIKNDLNGQDDGDTEHQKTSNHVFLDSYDNDDS